MGVSIFGEYILLVLNIQLFFFQPGVDPALPQAFPEAPFAAGGGGARRRGSALQEGVQEE